MNQLTIPLDEQIACVEREIKMRERAYPRWVAEKRMTQKKADYELAAMRAVRETISGIFQSGQTITSHIAASTTTSSHSAADVPLP